MQVVQQTQGIAQSHAAAAVSELLVGVKPNRMSVHCIDSNSGLFSSVLGLLLFL